MRVRLCQATALGRFGTIRRRIIKCHAVEGSYRVHVHPGRWPVPVQPCTESAAVMQAMHG